jgi:hypothetical protein
MASTRIYRNVKIDRHTFNTESTNFESNSFTRVVSNQSDHDLMGYIVFTYTFHLWGDKRDVARVATHAGGVK